MKIFDLINLKKKRIRKSKPNRVDSRKKQRAKRTLDPRQRPDRKEKGQNREGTDREGTDRQGDRTEKREDPEKSGLFKQINV